VRVTEAMATELLGAYEAHRIQHPTDHQLFNDLRKPERITTPGGRVSIAASRDGDGHADHFWALALALEASNSAVTVAKSKSFSRGSDRMERSRERSVLA
jgi:phage FluMu gp28-like protein